MTDIDRWTREASRRWGKRLMGALLGGLAMLLGVGCIQDNVLIPTNVIEGKIIPTGVEIPPPTTAPGSVTVTVNVTVPTVGIRLNTVGSGTNVSIIRPIGPLPGSPETTFASVTGDFKLITEKKGFVKAVARGVEYHIGWTEVFFNGFNLTETVAELDSVNLLFSDPLRANGDANLVVKKSGEVAFLVFAEDFTIRGVRVNSVRVVFDTFTSPTVGFNVPDDGSLDVQSDRPDDPVSFDLAAGDGVFTRVITGIDPGEHFYGFVINNDDIIRRDPYEEFSDVVGGTRRSGIFVR